MKGIFDGLFAGIVCCAFAQPVPAANAAKFREKIAWSFGSGMDGKVPYDSLIDLNGILYGTTSGGGTGCQGNGCGTVFAFDPTTGTEKVLYSFGGYDSDAEVPFASLIDINGILYGAAQGGLYGDGAVFSFDPQTDSETLVYSFAGGPDGQEPSAPLIDVNGTLYGTTISGGSGSGLDCGDSGCGTVFSIDLKTGTEKVLHSFCSKQGCADGYESRGGMINMNGTLYGTTAYGGAAYCGGFGCGTVFSLDPTTGKEKVLHSFCQTDCADGANPFGGLIDENGTFYGTTTSGGSTGWGVLFALDPKSKVETVLYSFCSQSQDGCLDGANPYGITYVKGKLYGVTNIGGTVCGDCGTVYSFDLNTGTEKVLHSFAGGADGAAPQAGLISVKGELFGTTPSGGGTGCGSGCGTVFVLKKR